MRHSSTFRLLKIITMVFSFLLLIGGEKSFAKGPVKVVVGIAPYVFLVEKIGGDRVEVDALIGQGQDPHTYEPNPKQILSLSRADIFMMVDLEFEKILFNKLKGGGSNLVVDLNEGLDMGDEIGHEHGENDHEGVDYHTWMSPLHYAKQAENVVLALSKIDPDGASFYKSNLTALQREINLISDRISTMLSPFKGKHFMVFHPAFGHFGEAFGLKQKAVTNLGKRPSPRRIARVISAARKDGVKIIFVQPQFDQQSAKIIASAVGGAVVSIDPLAKDVLQNYRDIATKFERAFR